MKGFFRTAGNYRLRLPALLLALAMTATMLGDAGKGKPPLPLPAPVRRSATIRRDILFPKKQRFLRQLCPVLVRLRLERRPLGKEMQNMVDNGWIF